MKKDSSVLILKVKEALPKDVGRAIVRIDPEDMKALSVEVGEILEIAGKRKTPAKVMPCYAEERGKGIIQMDGVSRENAQIGLDEKVKIHKISYKPASKITLAPLTISSLLQRDKDTLYLGSLIAGLPVVAGDRIRATFFGSRHCDFKVLDTIPNEGVVLIGPDTLFRIETKTKPEEVSAKISYEDIGGLSTQIQRIREMIELPLRYPQVFERLGIDAPKGVLLFGPPGTGKTLIARAVANETDAYFTSMSGPECMGKFYGESEGKLRALFEDAQAHAPAIVFIDEIESIAPKREEMGAEKQVERRVVSQLLALMDGLESRGQVIVIGATNVPNLLDPALRRPGRFDREISIPIPDKNGRKEILEIHTRGMPLAKNLDLDKLAEITHGFSVGPDTKAQIINPDGHFENIKIKHLAKRQKKWIFYGNGSRYSLLKGYKTLGIDKNGRVERVDIKAIHIHPKQPLYTVTTEKGKKIDVTLGHSLFTVGNDGAIVPVKVKEIRKGDYIVTINTFAEPFKHLSDINIPKTCREKTVVLKRKTKYQRKLKYPLPESVKVNRKLMRLLGYYVAEGWSPRTDTVCFSNTNPGIINEINTAISSISPLPRSYDAERCTLDVCSTGLNSFLTYLGCGTNAHTKRIPSIVYNAQKDIALEFLKAYLKGDGHCRGCVTMSTELAEDLHLLFKRFGIDTRVYKRNKDSANVVEPISYSDEKMFIKTFGFPLKEYRKEVKTQINSSYSDRVSISIYNTLLSIKNKIGTQLGSFLPSYYTKGKKPKSITRERLLRVSKNLFDSRYLQIMEILLESTLKYSTLEKEIRKKIGWYLQRLQQKGIVTKEKGRYCLSTVGKNTIEVATRIKNLLHNKQIRFTKVLNIQRGKPSVCYDLEVPDYEMFTASNGILLHNTGADLAALAREAAMSALRKILPKIDFEMADIPYETLMKLEVIMDNFLEAMKEVEPSAIREVFVEVPDVKWEDVGGLEDVKRRLKETVEWPLKYPELFKKSATDPSKGILLYGRPGTGKTLVAKAVANESGVNFISVKGPQLISKYVGESERGIREIFRKAKQASPAILFFDELDAIVPIRSGGDASHVTERVISQFLTELDGIEELKGILILGATNRLDIVDPAVLRPGRFDLLLELPIPDERTRMEIFKIHAKGKPLDKDIDLNELVKATDKFTGADIEAIVRSASMLAIREFIDKEKGKVTKEKLQEFSIKKRHFGEALRAIRK